MATIITSIALSTQRGFIRRPVGWWFDICMESAMYRIAPTRKM
jgi:hypothetical protein